jgi:ribosome-binding protein aMBF1 (putative translation factor)
MTNASCPVCGAAITGSGTKTTVSGKEITVCCEACAKKAKETPTKYAGTAK